MRYAVIGAGTAGCIVAARLSEDPSNQVVLLEGGQDRSGGNRDQGIRSLNWIQALAAPDAFWPQIQAARQDGDARRQYLRGRGVGGSGAVNAMICLPGIPQDYDRWASEFGCVDWSWEQVQPWFTALHRAVQPCPRTWWTPVDLALESAADGMGLATGVDTYAPDDGVGALYLSATGAGRFSSAEAWLDPARARPNLRVRVNSWVDRIVLHQGRASAVSLASGERIEADHVVLCAGAFESPAILLRSGIERAGLGRNLRDHPAASLGLRLRQEVRANDLSVPCINAVLRTSSSASPGDIHLLPLHGSLDDGATDGVVMAALMTVRSTGHVRLDESDPLGHPVIDMDMLDDPTDRQAMHGAIDVMLDVLRSPAFESILAEIVVDDAGTELRDLRTPTGADAWLRRRMGDYFHACGTCRMGDALDPNAVVGTDGALLGGYAGIHVIDASVMPDVPAANTHWPTVMVAERLTAGLMGRDLAAVAATMPRAVPG
ncbi:MAG: GMC family oxidoreductase [Actinomycetales bacterium]